MSGPHMAQGVLETGASYAPYSTIPPTHATQVRVTISSILKQSISLISLYSYLALYQARQL